MIIAGILLAALAGYVVLFVRARRNYERSQP